MKFLLFLILAATPTVAQQGPRIAPACGLKTAAFTTQSSPASVPPPPTGETQAQVFFIQDNGPGGEHQHYTTLIGMDGNWVGGYKENAYFVMNVAPGEHHICANIQSQSSLGKTVALAHFNAEPGKVYYFRTQFLAGLNTIYPIYPYLTLDRPDSDEALYLIGTFPVSHATTGK